MRSTEVSENTWMRKNSMKFKEGKILVLLEKSYARAANLISGCCDCAMLS
jgi:hypothetical protein